MSIDGEVPNVGGLFDIKKSNLKRLYISITKLQAVSRAIGGAHSTDNSRDSITLNKSKTKLLHSSKSSLFFLGFEFRNIKFKFGWNTKNYTNVRPSMKSRSKLYTSLRDLLAKRRHWTIEWIVYKLNELLIGWLNYFSISKVTHIWETIEVIIKHLD